MERLLHVPLELALVPAGVPAIATLEPSRHLREQFHSHDSLESRSLFLGAREHVLLGASRRGGAVAPGRYLRRLDDRFGAGRAALRDRAAGLEPLEASGPQARGLVVHAEGVRRHRRQALGGLSGSAMSISLLRLRSSRAFSASDRGSKDFGLAMARPPVLRRSAHQGSADQCRLVANVPHLWCGATAT